MGGRPREQPCVTPARLNERAKLYDGWVSGLTGLLDNGLVLSIDAAECIRADQVVELDLGLRPSPAGSSELLLHTDGPDAILVLLANHQDHTRAGPAIVTIVDCQQSVFGYPNDEARWGDRRLRGHGYGFFEVRDSPWPRRLQSYHRQAFPTRTVPRQLRHFGVACHESLGEFLAADILVELWPDPFEDAVHEALRRLSCVGDV
jgi:hypothetical protein